MVVDRLLVGYLMNPISTSLRITVDGLAKSEKKPPIWDG
jgi:hypothetical protein